MKFQLSNEILNHNGRVLYRVQALQNFNDVKAGDLGGYVESEANLSQDGNCWIYNNAKVFGNAKVFENARIFDEVQVAGNAEVYGESVFNEDLIIW